MFKKYFNHSNTLFFLGILGILFYVLAPIFFPHVANIRQPELLPVYSLMIGLGGMLRNNMLHNHSADSSGDGDVHLADNNGDAVAPKLTSGGSSHHGGTSHH